MGIDTILSEVEECLGLDKYSLSIRYDSPWGLQVYILYNQRALHSINLINLDRMPKDVLIDIIDFEIKNKGL